MDKGFGLLLLLYLHLAAITKGEIRCHCNESGCVSTGYMCKSHTGTCYTLVHTDQSQTNTETEVSVHGCVDGLRMAHRSLCNSALTEENLQQSSRSMGGSSLPLLLMCCKKDMCNYMKKFDRLHFVMNAHSNGSILRGRKQNQMSYTGNYPERNENRDLWFKAAVIAVPIAGGFILILLVLVAVRMLRSDSQRHRRLVADRRGRSLTKAQLYVADHFNDKDHGFASPSFAEKAVHLYKDVNSKVDRDGKMYERVRDKDIQQKLSPSVIVWGTQAKRDFATVV
ncbi:BMP and activin membrane-bound inhibitor homolog [Octopus vulgaris]|uniref:BMP and activin membrane-bound inhibitor homolog n=2 Tax=Octopus TaxID=6643 RepID=A0AA36B4E4_OCTVU|nr:BMP and activin membrane-bound inhibitor homolog [Octopus bimaculoides]XP_052826792.1 BMP and activin membrane-bound inhibitor homolog [Octopus bimaculoides]CAI9727710.1 BMP and activin membrane-bound inhibitor homolog [Octopus vulgaris]